MDLIQQAKEFHEQLAAMKKANQRLVKEVDLSDEEMLELVDIYPKWDVDTELKVGDYVRYNDSLYKVIQAHTTQSDWLPDQTPALFNEVVPKGVIPEWIAPTGGHDAYNKGDQVTHEGKIYISKIDGNTTIPNGDEPYNRYWEIVE